MSYQTPKDIVLVEGVYTVEFPAAYESNGTTYAFKDWEDGSTNPVRIISLNSDKTIIAYYEVSEMVKIKNSTTSNIVVTELGVIATTTLAPGEEIDTNVGTLTVDVSEPTP